MDVSISEPINDSAQILMDQILVKKTKSRSVWKSERQSAYYINNRELIRQRAKKRYQERKALKLCSRCSNKAIENRTHCIACWFYEAAVARLKTTDLTIVAALAKKLETQNYTCPYTGDRLIPGTNCHLDHIFPVSRFPELACSIDNVEWVAKRANYSKWDMTREEFLEVCELVATRTKTKGIQHPLYYKKRWGSWIAPGK